MELIHESRLSIESSEPFFGDKSNWKPEKFSHPNKQIY